MQSFVGSWRSQLVGTPPYHNAGRAMRGSHGARVNGHHGGVAAVCGGAVSVLGRVERQQLRWVAAGAPAAVAGLLEGGRAPADHALVDPVRHGLVIPLAVAVAVLRYRLWGLDRLISRTVTYTLVTALLVVPYLLILPAATRLAQGSGSLAVAAVTLAAAAAFHRPAAASSRWSTGASTGAATTPPEPWRRSRPTCASRST